MCVDGVHLPLFPPTTFYLLCWLALPTTVEELLPRCAPGVEPLAAVSLFPSSWSPSSPFLGLQLFSSSLFLLSTSVSAVPGTLPDGWTTLCSPLLSRHLDPCLLHTPVHHWHFTFTVPLLYLFG